ncbi:bifunctional hydroxymethylpyrimidine kinase/phosphomethylpyrimidine kinase [Fructilactobacillus fructivorans]|uniref:Hydroxymethylpyrimidine/phosphomethylpyrimidine kinase n=1 Tax=Fructilactobacillus fructivorans TaxID=1614 RepID=A0AAE6P0L6_9LACO|nr:bifunctional hydroxymethylpyrimidine kinase/phosphomethylpyrimidine kinase [Fructilactobacillus fructivorans]KRK57179.1 phosphomethylpyrimidine kinase [Fructilactobacillus fructivorans]KRN12108.1 phosphomethylpyrimidine kinase [Fructilactobacillus fructivorans]KRN40423.1 phosphomethylpyrimidine kinase [Fructilactobacillus fructivorans]KRN42767.1 phosphomethylpyrimidine kinase [Fructilactobacillus fructivorans]QFX92333.1 bifunctional hydroxymethylpyrimidine kinase/phosphomethylpyrimidine kin
MSNEIKQYPEALTIAGTDSGGGAGMEADIKTMQACQVFSTNVVAGITAQNTIGVQDTYPLPEKIINEQFASICDDFDIKATKTGALFDERHVQLVSDNIKKYKLGQIVVDPVMVAKGGSILLEESAIETLINELIPLADLVTPNLPEAEKITNQSIESDEEVKKAARNIQIAGAKNVMIKGGHGTNKIVKDYVLLEDGSDFWLTVNRVDTVRTHGTGDTLSSAIVSALARGETMESAIRFGKNYLDKIIRKPLIIGHGNGPLNHGMWE